MHAYTHYYARRCTRNIHIEFGMRPSTHRIRISEVYEWKTAFRTRCGHFEYIVMPFGLLTDQAVQNQERIAMAALRAGRYCKNKSRTLQCFVAGVEYHYKILTIAHPAPVPPRTSSSWCCVGVPPVVVSPRPIYHQLCYPVSPRQQPCLSGQSSGPHLLRRAPPRKHC